MTVPSNESDRFVKLIRAMDAEYLRFEPEPEPEPQEEEQPRPKPKPRIL
jgi:hypothetical protein